MKFEDLSLTAQLVESIDLAVKELEKAYEKKDIAKFNKYKAEILKFQKQMAQALI